MSEKEHRVSRRQFLNYTLTGVGGFMAAGILMPMTRFALDPVLRKEAGTDMVAVVQVKDKQYIGDISNRAIQIDLCLEFPYRN